MIAVWVFLALVPCAMVFHLTCGYLPVVGRVAVVERASVTRVASTRSGGQRGTSASLLFRYVQGDGGQGRVDVQGTQGLRAQAHAGGARGA